MKISTIKKTNRFYSNTIMLYCLQFSNYLFNFITVPYQTRILGPGFFGKLGMATALTTYFQLLLDYGFILSATEDVASNQDDLLYSKILNRLVVIFRIFIKRQYLRFFTRLYLPGPGKDEAYYNPDCGRKVYFYHFNIRLIEKTIGLLDRPYFFSDWQSGCRPLVLD